MILPKERQLAFGWPPWLLEDGGRELDFEEGSSIAN
jgi:hypothetical protein